MGETSARSEQRESIKQLMERVDALIPSPEKRSLKVWEKLDKKDLNIWDLICFCNETLGYASTLFPEFESAIKTLSLNVYATHYRGSAELMEWERKPENQLDAVDPDKLTKADGS